MALDIIISIADILFLIALLWIIQFYINPGSNSSLSFLPAWLVDRQSVFIIAVFFFLFGMKNLAGFLVSRSHYRYLGGVAIRISQNNLSQYQQSEFEQFINKDSSSFIRNIAFQPFEFCQYLLSGVQQIITQSFLIALTAAAIIFFNAKLFLLLLIILLPPVTVIFYFIKNRLDKTKKEIQVANERSFQFLLDALKGYVESNIYNRNEFFMQRFIHSRKIFSKALFESISIQNIPARFIEIFAEMGLFILIAIASWSGVADSNTLITMGAFMAAAYKIIPGIVKIINASGQLRAYEFAAADLTEQVKIKNSGNGKSHSQAINSIEFKNISFSFASRPVLKNFNLSLNKGDLTGISGDSGIGKTTVINLLLGFLKPETGNIFFNNEPVSGDEIKKYWPQISYVRQQPFFIFDTISRNITLEEEGYNKDKLDNAIAVSGLAEFIAASPEGLNKIITENGKNISGGQQQRIAIARALYKDADLVLLDEPFNELDEASVVSILGHFRKMADTGKIVILVTHDKLSLSYCNKIISLGAQQ